MVTLLRNLSCVKANPVSPCPTLSMMQARVGDVVTATALTFRDDLMFENSLCLMKNVLAAGEGLVCLL